MLRTLDELTNPVLRPVKVSALLAIPIGLDDPTIFLRKCAALADATDLAFEVATTADSRARGSKKRHASHTRASSRRCRWTHGWPDWSNAGATIVALPKCELAAEIATSPIDRHVFIADPTALHIYETGTDLRARHPYAQTAGDRLRIGYGRFTVYLGAAAGCGKTYAMLDRAHQMKAEGIDVVAAIVETHGRADTERMLEGLEVLPRKNNELDREALMARRPQVALIDELAHTNAPGSDYPKRYEEVLSIIRSGISVITTLNVQHLEGLSDAVLRMTGQRVRETLPDGILELADDVDPDRRDAAGAAGAAARREDLSTRTDRSRALQLLHDRESDRAARARDPRDDSRAQPTAAARTVSQISCSASMRASGRRADRVGGPICIARLTSS